MKKNNQKSLSFRVWHPSKHPRELTNLLALVPKHTQVAGDERVTPSGKVLKGVYKENYWCFIYESSEEYLSDMVESMNKLLLRKKESIKEIELTGGKLEYFLGCYVDSSYGEEFSWAILRDCAELKISLGFDIYSV